jgi:hypothetical protein
LTENEVSAAVNVICESNGINIPPFGIEFLEVSGLKKICEKF